MKEKREQEREREREESKREKREREKRESGSLCVLKKEQWGGADGKAKIHRERQDVTL